MSHNMQDKTRRKSIQCFSSSFWYETLLEVRFEKVCPFLLPYEGNQRCRQSLQGRSDTERPLQENVVLGGIKRASHWLDHRRNLQDIAYSPLCPLN